MRCGAIAVVARGLDWFCGPCALSREWEEIIAIAQEALSSGSRAAAVSPSPPPVPVAG